MLYSIFLGGIFNLVIALVLIVSNQTEKLRAERKERESLEGASISSKWDFSCCELLEQLEVRYFNVNRIVRNLIVLVPLLKSKDGTRSAT